MFLEIFNRTSTKRKFIVNIEKRLRMPKGNNLEQCRIFNHFSISEHINYLLLNKKPYVAIKI